MIIDAMMPIDSNIKKAYEKLKKFLEPMYGPKVFNFSILDLG